MGVYVVRCRLKCCYARDLVHFLISDQTPLFVDGVIAHVTSSWLGSAVPFPADERVLTGCSTTDSHPTEPLRYFWDPRGHTGGFGKFFLGAAGSEACCLP